MNRLHLAGLFGAGLICAAGRAVLGADKPDFSGTWALDLEKSRLQVGAKIDRGTITIEHKEPDFRFSRVFVIGGKEDPVSYGAEEKFRGPVRKYDNLWVADREA